METMIVRHFLLASLLISVISQADIFKWVDEEGITHFSDRPKNNFLTNTTTKPKSVKFSPLTKDAIPAKEKLSLIQGKWQQIDHHPKEMDIFEVNDKEILEIEAQELAKAKEQGLDISKYIEAQKKRITTTTKIKSSTNNANNLDTLLTISGNNISIRSIVKGVIFDDSDQNLKTHTGKLETYSDIPVIINGYWTFSGTTNPFLNSYIGEMGSSQLLDNEFKNIRLDIKGKQMMVTVPIPKKYNQPELKILYERK